MTAGKLFLRVAALAGAIAVSAKGVLAHHPMGGATPSTLLQGLLSGIGHPILGLDHFAFVVGIGLLAGISGLGLTLPALFVAAMTAGVALHLAGGDIPYVELLVGLSVFLMGVALWRSDAAGRNRAFAWAAAAAGLFHGFAFAETAIGAEPTPLTAYILGLCATQMAIAMIAWQLAGGQSRWVERAALPSFVRIGGIAIALVGVTYVWLAARTIA